MTYDYAAIQAELDALNKGVAKNPTFTEEMDFSVRFAFENGKNKDEFVSWFKKRYGFGCRETLAKRYRELTS